MKLIISETLKMLADIVYPPNTVCMLCGREAQVDENGMCKSCSENLFEPTEFETIRNSVEYVDDILVFFSYRYSVRYAVVNMKYHSCTYLAKYFAGFMKPDPGWAIDFVTYVPMHPRKERLRGYNQSKLLAREVARCEGLSFQDNVLKKIKMTESQARLSRAERLISPVGTYRANESMCRGKRILLVDDICTTGTTINTCARELKENGAESVYAMTLAHG